MKRRISSIIALVAVLMLLLIPLFATNAFASEETVTLTFDNTSKRTVYTTSQQVWTENGITFTNDKASSTSNVADYSNPVRLYANSSITIECSTGNIIKMVFTCSSSKYATNLQESIGAEATASESGSTVTVTPDGSSSTYTVDSLTAQVRLNSVTVYYSTQVATPEYTASFDVPAGATEIEDLTGSKITLPAAPALADKDYAQEYTFLGWTTSSLAEDSTLSPEIYEAGTDVTLENDTTFYAVYTYTLSGSSSYVLTDIADISSTDVVVITALKSGAVYAMSNDNGTSAPASAAVTVSGSSIIGEVADNIKWNIVVDGNNFTVFPNGTTATWLYCTNANNGVKVGTGENKTFTIDAASGYIKNTGTSRYLGIYNTQDWRCYTTSTTTNIANQQFGFYVLSEGATTYYATSLKVSECEHTNTITETIDATCTVAGSITTTCNDCESVISVTELPATGHTYVDGICKDCSENAPIATFIIPEGATPIDSKFGPNVTLPEAPTLDTGKVYLNTYTFVGWSVNTVDSNTTSTPVTYAPNSTVTIAEDTVYYAVYTYSASVKAYQKTDLANITSTDTVVIAITTSTGDVYAMTNDNGSSSAPAAVKLIDENGTITNDVATNLLWNITVDGSNFTVYPNGTTETWLYCTNTNNGVRVGNNENKTFIIEDTYGYLYNTATSRYVGVYNTQNWRCYTPEPTEENNSNIKDQTLGFYVLVEGNNTVEYFTTSLMFATGNFTSASLNIGQDLSIRYHTIIGAEESIEDYTVRFTMNGEEIVVAEYEFDTETGKYIFSFCGIAPQCMGDIIKAELLLGGEVVNTKEEYSVKQYVIDALGLYADDTELCQLLTDLLYYGAAAQSYRGYKTSDLVTNDVAGLGEYSNLTPTETTRTFITNGDTTNASFKSAGVRFDCRNKIYVKFETTDTSKVTVKINGVAADFELVEDNVYILYTNDISALEFGQTFEFVLEYDGALVQTLTYSVNDYAYGKQSGSTVSDLAIALYNYGKSAVAYNNK